MEKKESLFYRIHFSAAAVRLPPLLGKTKGGLSAKSIL